MSYSVSWPNKRDKHGVIKLITILLIANMLAVTGCALSPQSVALRPYIDARAEAIGRDRVLQLSVTDQRQQSAFGVRGGIYETATINPRSALEPAVFAALAERLQASGFNIVNVLSNNQQSATLTSVDEGSVIPLTMQVNVLTLDYNVVSGSLTGGPLLNEIRLQAEVEAQISNAGTSRSGIYRASSAQRRIGYPGAAENEEMINDVLSQALKQLLQDRYILELLAQ